MPDANAMQLGNGRQSLAWWGKLDDGLDRGRVMVEAAKLIWNLPGEMLRRDLDVVNVRMYEQTANASLNDFGGKFFAAGGAMGESIQAGAFDPRESSTYNVAKSAIDTMASQIASTDQRARFITTAGKYQQRRRARGLQRFTDGLAHELKLHALRQRNFSDAAVTESGLGAIHFYENADGRCAAQRVIPTELAIDPLDGWIDQKPRTLYRRHPAPRSWVMSKFGKTDKLRTAIENANALTTATGHHSDQLELWEAWHLPTTPTSDDGWHAVALDREDGTLLVEQFKARRHRIVLFSIEDRFATPFGNSPMSQVRALQTQININLLRIARAQKIFCARHVYVDRTAKVKKSSLTNEIGSVWEGTGPNAPQEIKMEAVSPELYAQVERDAQRIFDVLGVNRGASVGNTSRGAGAPAAAMREEKEKVDQRNAVRQQRWEANFVECISVALDVVREIAEHRSGSYVVAAPNKNGRANNRALTLADWKESALDEDDYVLEIQPASPYPTEPAALIAFGYDMIQAGAWEGKDLARYIQDADADAKTDLETSDEDTLDRTFDDLMYSRNPKVAIPDEFTNYALALELGRKYLHMGEADGVPERNLERVRKYLRKCQQYQSKVAAKTAPQQSAAPGGQPAGAPAQAAA